MTLLSLLDSNVGEYAMSIKVSLLDWSTVESVYVPLKVDVSKCTPVTLVPTFSTKSISV
jgi:hypothetical protein